MHYVLYVATPSNLPLDRSPLDSRKISTNYDSTNRVRRITNKTLVNPRLFFSLSLFLFLSVSSVQRYAKWTVVARDVCVIRYISYFSILNWRRYLGGFQGWRSRVFVKVWRRVIFVWCKRLYRGLFVIQKASIAPSDCSIHNSN